MWWYDRGKRFPQGYKQKTLDDITININDSDIISEFAQKYLNDSEYDTVTMRTMGDGIPWVISEDRTFGSLSQTEKDNLILLCGLNGDDPTN